MIDKAEQDLVGVREVVEDNIGEFVAELRAIDLVDLISFIRFECFPTVEDLINSSTELFFKPEMMVFSWAAGVEVRWDALPAVTIGLEFRHPEVSVFFNLTICDDTSSVEVLGIALEVPQPDTGAVLVRAFAEARLLDEGGSARAEALVPRGPRRSQGLS